MNSVDVKRMIIVSGLEANIQGMIAANKIHEMNGDNLVYFQDDFDVIAEEMQRIARMNDQQIEKY